MAEIEAKLKAAEQQNAELRSAQEAKAKETSAAEQQLEEAEKARLALQQELEQVRTDWKQSQWEVETQLKEAADAARNLERKLEEAEDARIGLEQELRQRTTNMEFEQKQMEQRQSEIQKLVQQIEAQKKDLEMEQTRRHSLESQVASYKSMLDGQGLQDINELSKELRKAQETAQQLKLSALELEKKADLAHERERELKQSVSEKDATVAEFKNRSIAAERKMEMLREEYDQFRAGIKKQAEQSLQEIAALKKKQADDLAALNAAHQQEIQQAKHTVSEEVAARIQAELPPPGPSAQMIESQVRQDLENEYMQRVRDKEADWEQRLADAKEETKKEMDRLKWDVENGKEELKRAREARVHIEREAQELLQQAEEHYQNELQKKIAATEQVQKKSKGLFSTIGLSLGRFLDTPLIDTRKKKDEAASPSFKE
jgi:DNA repair exonuclease SbcCD ATPase subunit